MAYDFMYKGIYYKVSGLNENEVLVDFAPKDISGEVHIPSSFTYNKKTYKVTGISTDAFRYCKEMTSISIPYSIRDIYDGAFVGCLKLTSVNIEDLTAWCNIYFQTSGSNPLSYAKHLYVNGYEVKKLVVPNGVTKINNYAFYKCSFLISVVIPNSVTRIGTSAFADNSSLSSVEIPNSMTSIGRSAFQNCSSLTSVTINNGTKTIGDNAFQGCTALTSVNIPNSVTSIGGASFFGCKELSTICIPSSVTSIGIHSFSNCSKLTMVRLDSPKIVSDNYSRTYKLSDIFGTNVTQYVLGEGITSIGDSAFYDSSLISIVIPTSVNSIGKGAFDFCRKLTSVFISNLTAWCNINFESNSNPLSNNSCLFLNGEEINNLVVPNGVTSIKEHAFSSCKGLISVTIPNSVTSIENGAFSGCRDLISITMTNSVTKIGNFAFYECDNLTSITIPNSVTSIGRYAFLGCKKLNNIIIPNNVSSIGDYAFQEETILYVKNGTSSLIELWDSHFYKTYDVDTKDRLGAPFLFVSEKTASSVVIGTDTTSYIKHDNYNIILYLDNKEMKGTKVKYIGLDPNSEHSATMMVYHPNSHCSYSSTQKVKTRELSLTTIQPKVISLGNVIVSALTNLDEEETNVGFEWRRTDWPDDFASNTGTAALYEGTMEGYIRNLNTEKLWKYRPYYLSNSGTYFYGDWVGIDPTNTSYFEPTVHTYAKIEIEGNTALVKGYALRGTDNVTVQGFMYWKDANHAKASLAPRKVVEIPDDAVTVKATGQTMTATLKNLDYDTTYDYVAFVTTSEGETFYGDVRSFTTGADLTGIEYMELSEQASATEVARYNMNGYRIYSPQRGINIVRMSDGTTRKVVVK